MLEWVVIAAYSLIGLALLLLAILSLNLSIIVGLHLFHRRRGLAIEAALLARPLPPDAALPRVVVQLPVVLVTGESTSAPLKKTWTVSPG